MMSLLLYKILPRQSIHEAETLGAYSLESSRNKIWSICKGLRRPTPEEAKTQRTWAHNNESGLELSTGQPLHPVTLRNALALSSPLLPPPV